MGSIAYRLEGKGIPTVGLVFEEQEANYRAQYGLAGYAELPTVAYPGDSLLTPDNARIIGREVAPEVVRGLTDGRSPYMQRVGDRLIPWPQEFTFSGGTYDDAYQAFTETFLTRGWSDGLPLVPPTPEKVAWLLTGTDLSPDEVIGRMGPSLGEVTVRAVAVNAAMAGARPEYMPVIVAAMKSITSYPYDYYSPLLRGIAPFVVVNGPITEEIGLNHRNNEMGPNSRYPAGATIGRAINLIIRNVGGWGFGLIPAAQHGQPGQYTGLVIAESEHTGTWEPLNVQMGFPAGSNTVTVLGVMGSINVPGKALDHAASFVPPTTAAWPADRKAWEKRAVGVLLVTPMHALRMSAQGITKADVQEALYKYARVSREEFRRILGLDSGTKPSALVDWLLTTIPEDQEIPIGASPENFLVVSSGGWCTCVTSAWLNSDQFMSYPVTVEIQKPAAWEKLLSDR